VSTELSVVGGLSIGIFAAAKIAHLIDDETVAKMGHPVVLVRLDVGHPLPSFRDLPRCEHPPKSGISQLVYC
jgi:hypothetical protein